MTFLTKAAAALGLSSPHLNGLFRFPNGPTSNKYTPHQGKRECARRVRQMERDYNNLEARAAAQGFGLIPTTYEQEVGAA